MSDLIAAYAAGELPAAIGVIRLSGDGAWEKIWNRVFFPKKINTPCIPNHMFYGELRDSEGETIDLCMACFYRGPRSYTGEDMAEIFTHGSAAVAAGALRACFDAGARGAQAGEFTRRAFLAGRLDLHQAEATAELIYSQTEEAARNAAYLLKGGRSREIRGVRENLLDLISHFYAICDYPDEDIEPFDYVRARETLEESIGALEPLYEGYLHSGRLENGLGVALIGRPNSGKSSLFNRLAGEERAIVTEEAGTTRDVIAQRVSLGGKTFQLLDTAGLREGAGRAESIGVERSRKAAREAGIVIGVFDRSEPPAPEDMETISLLREAAESRGVVAALNKSDLPPVFPREILSGLPALDVSAETGEGIGDLSERLCGLAPPPSHGIITSPRQGELLGRAIGSLRDALRSAKDGATPDAFLLDAEEGARRLGEILGEETDGDIVDGIFSRFCVGK